MGGLKADGSFSVPGIFYSLNCDRTLLKRKLPRPFPSVFCFISPLPRLPGGPCALHSRRDTRRLAFSHPYCFFPREAGRHIPPKEELLKNMHRPWSYFYKINWRYHFCYCYLRTQEDSTGFFLK